jgi:hypothetical protein
MLKHAGAEQAARVVGALPYLLLAVCVLFLAMQLMLKLARSHWTNAQIPDNDKTHRSGKL